MRATALELLACALVALASCSRPERPRTIVWIEVDTLRADALGCYGNASVGEHGAAPSPHVDSLSADGVRFERAWSTAPWTAPSLASQLTGRWPWEHGTTRLLEPLPRDETTFVERLRDAGWRTAGVMTNFVARELYGFGQGFERWDESLATGHEGATGEAAVERLLGFTDEFARDPEEGLFLFVLLFEPHYRYEAHEGLRFGPGFDEGGGGGGAPYDGPLAGDEDLWDLRARAGELDPHDAAFLRGRYQSEVAHADRAIGRLLDGLAERGLADEALVVFTSDHGEEILERGWIGHTISLHEELVRVPLILRLPRSWRSEPRVGVVEAPVSLVDLGATVLDLAGVAARGFPGRSLRGLLDGGPAPRERLYLHVDFEPELHRPGAESKRTLQMGVVDAASERKWIVDHLPEDRGRVRARLFDLRADPFERRDLAGDARDREAARGLWAFRGLVPAPLSPGESLGDAIEPGREGRRADG